MTDQEFIKALARELARERKRLGFTQQEIYDETGIHIGRIECMEKSIQVTTLYRICEYMDISCAEILYRILQTIASN